MSTIQYHRSQIEKHRLEIARNQVERVTGCKPPQRTDSAGERTCLSCGQRHPFNPDGTPVGGALPCGH